MFVDTLTWLWTVFPSIILDVNVIFTILLWHGIFSFLPQSCRARLIIWHLFIIYNAKLISPYQWNDNSGTDLIWYASISLKSRQWTMKRSSDFAWKRGTTLELYNYSYEKPDVLIKISQCSHFSWRHGFHLLILFNWDHGINETLYSCCYVEFNYVSVPKFYDGLIETLLKYWPEWGVVSHCLTWM